MKNKINNEKLIMQLKSSIISLVKHLKINWFTYVKEIIYEYKRFRYSYERNF